MLLIKFQRCYWAYGCISIFVLVVFPGKCGGWYAQAYTNNAVYRGYLLVQKLL